MACALNFINNTCLDYPDIHINSYLALHQTVGDVQGLWSCAVIRDQATWVGGELWSGFCKLLITLHRWFCNEQKSSYCVCLWLWKTDCREHFRGLSNFKVVGRTPNLINCFYFLVFVSKKPSLNWRVCTLQCTIFRVMLIVLSIFVMH